jgi:flavin reductase (DIM6/NTAB) family NADH-FMN oxidoreductase RutF
MDAFLAGLDYPMLVVTASMDGERSGCLVGFYTQCSISPEEFLVCISKRNHTYRVAERAARLGVHTLPVNRHDLAALFGEQTGDDVDKFSRCEWRPGPGGTPVLSGAAAWFVGTVLHRVDLGDHVGFRVVPEECGAAEPEMPLLFFRDVQDLQAGHDA